MTSRSRYTAILDANVLVSIRLTDLFVQLAVDDVFRAKWTVDIHREWMAVLKESVQTLTQHDWNADATEWTPKQETRL